MQKSLLFWKITELYLKIIFRMINLMGGFHAYVDTVNTRAHYATVYEYRQNQDNQELFQLMTALVNESRLKLLKM